ncbi:MAG: hypothetical protein RIF34_08280 [Candidatus Kapaibacterium sp.]
MSNSNQEILDFFSKLVNDKGVLDIPEEVFLKMEKEYGELLKNEFTTSRMFKLPQFEIDFFKWVKENDRLVWNDLWTEEDENYAVSIEFLPLLLEKDGRGFPICDLQTVDNYYFMPQLLVDRESDVMVEAAKIRFLEKRGLTPSQLLALEIHFGGIDIWHFAYKHKIELQEAKAAVASLVEDQVLVHLTDAEHLAPILEL